MCVVGCVCVVGVLVCLIVFVYVVCDDCAMLYGLGVVDCIFDVCVLFMRYCVMLDGLFLCVAVVCGCVLLLLISEFMCVACE